MLKRGLPDSGRFAVSVAGLSFEIDSLHSFCVVIIWHGGKSVIGLATVVFCITSAARLLLNPTMMSATRPSLRQMSAAGRVAAPQSRARPRSAYECGFAESCLAAVSDSMVSAWLLMNAHIMSAAKGSCATPGARRR